MAGKIQNADIKSTAELVAAGADASSLPNDDKIYVTANAVNKTLKQAIIDGNIGGGGGAGAFIGSILTSGSITPPSGFLFADGRAVSRASYAKLFTVIGTAYGTGDGSTTFNIPNLQGVFLRGSGTQVVAGKTFSSTLGASQKDSTSKNGLGLNDPGHTHVPTNYGNVNPGGAFSVPANSGGSAFFPGSAGIVFTTSQTGINLSGGDVETSPANVTVAYHICYDSGMAQPNPTPVNAVIGSILASATSAPPDGYFYADGRAISRTTYVKLFNVIGTNHGVGDGSTTFNIPNLQGVFLRGSGSQTIGGVAYNATLGQTVGDTFQDHTHSASVGSSSAYGGGSNGHLQVANTGGGGASYAVNSLPYASDGTVYVNGANSGRAGSETRPANMAVAYHICFDSGMAAPGPAQNNYVNARYSSPSAFGFNGGSAATFATKSWDTDNAWSGNKFTAPFDGKYNLSGLVETGPTAFGIGGVVRVYAVTSTGVVVYGQDFTVTANGTYKVGLTYNIDVALDAGDYVQLATDSSVVSNFSGNADRNYIQIKKFG